MPHPAPRGLGTHSLSGTSLLPGAPWDGAGQAAWPTVQRTNFDGNRHNPSALRRRHGAGAVGAPGWLSLPHGWAAVPSQRHTVRRGRAPLLSTRPQGVHPPPRLEVSRLLIPQGHRQGLGGGGALVQGRQVAFSHEF